MERFLNKLKSEKFITAFLVVIILFISTGCGDDENSVISPEQPNNVYLENSQKITSMSASSILNLITNDEPEIASIVTNKTLSDIEVYKITYKTVDVEGKDIIASGLVVYPKGKTNLPLFSNQHGTIFSQLDAPSTFNLNKLSIVFSAAMGSNGYAAIMPDYLGFGESSNYTHPFEHKKTYASASYHMILASKEFLASQNVTLNNKLFLTGYSSGGYASMALHQYIENNSSLEVTMSAPAAGSYNKTAYWKEMFQRNTDFSFPGLPIWAIGSYNWIYKLNRNWRQYLTSPNASIMSMISNPLDYANAPVSKNPQDLYSTDYLNGINNGTDTEYLNIIADNDIFDWTPRAPITLYYGTDDDLVFPINSTSAYERLKANGADVNIVAYQGKDHISAGIPYILDVFNLFESLK